MSNMYVVYKSGEFYGILNDKKEKKLFVEQRDMSSYMIAKVPEKDVMRTMEYHNIGQYLSMESLDFIMFPFEELGMIEHFERQLEDAIDDLDLLNTLVTSYVKLNDDEAKVFKLFAALFTFIFADERNNGIFISDTRKGLVNQRYLIKSWIGMVDDGYLEDTDF